jgi:signal transduction histidine kinase
LHQVFLNLITNALEAMTAVASRPSLLRITSGIASSELVVTVEDTGVGIADQDRGRVLEPFFSTKAAGTGVGLTICKVIIDAHGGRLQVSANKPYGTIFRVTLPMSDDE